MRRAIIVTALCVGTALGGFAVGHARCPDPFDAYRELRGRIVAYQRWQDADGTVWLLGSSTLERINAGRLGAAVTNLAVGGDTILDAAKRVPSQRQLARSKGVLIHVGFNDLKHGMSPDEALQHYDRLLTALRPAPKAICVTLQPLAPAAETGSPRLAAALRAFNAGVRQRCAGPGSRQLVDLEHLLTSFAGGDAARLYVDEVHLSNAGYDLLAAALRDTILRQPDPAS